MRYARIGRPTIRVAIRLCAGAINDSPDIAQTVGCVASKRLADGVCGWTKYTLEKISCGLLHFRASITHRLSDHGPGYRIYQLAALQVL